MKTSFGAMTGRERLCFVLKYLFMALCVVVALFPIIWVILSSHWIWRRSSSSSATA